LPHIFKYVVENIIFCAGHFACMARMVLCNQYAEVMSSIPTQNADVYSRVFLGFDMVETDSPSVLFVSMWESGINTVCIGSDMWESGVNTVCIGSDMWEFVIRGKRNA
jgi:hypothetical protein